MEKANSPQSWEALVRIGSSRLTLANSKAGFGCFRCCCWELDSTAEVTRAADLTVVVDLLVAVMVEEEARSQPGLEQR